MGTTANIPFDKRLRKIVKRHNRLANGVVHRVDKTGLIVARPRIYQPRFPLKGLLLMVALGFLFKGYVYAALGSTSYDARVETLADGSVFEMAGGWIMQADPATVFIADMFGAFGL